MAVAVATLEDMTKRREKPETTPRPVGRPPGRKPTESISARLSPSLAQRFNALVDAIRPKTTVTAVLEMLIEDWVQTQEGSRQEEPE